MKSNNVPKKNPNHINTIGILKILFLPRRAAKKLHRRRVEPQCVATLRTAFCNSKFQCINNVIHHRNKYNR